MLFQFTRIILFQLNVVNFDEIKCLLILMFILVLQHNSSHSTLIRVKCEKQILPSVGIEPTTSCIHGKRFPAKPQGLHGRNKKNTEALKQHQTNNIKIL